MGHVAAYLYSLAIGLLVGLERERSHRGQAGQAYGIRTFALVALVGTLATEAGPVVVGVALAGVVALLVVGYRRTNEADPGTTTEVTAMATFLLGVLCYHDAALAAGIAIGVVALLMSKARLHRFVSDVLSDAELQDAIKFLVGAFVILPLLPRRGVGPYNVLNPSRIWLFVVVLTGISWVGYIAVRLLGARRGLLATGLASGFVSATAATAAMGRASREPATSPAALAGAQVASVVTYFELVAIMTVASPSIAWRRRAAPTDDRDGPGRERTHERGRDEAPGERRAGDGHDGDELDVGDDARDLGARERRGERRGRTARAAHGGRRRGRRDEPAREARGEQPPARPEQANGDVAHPRDAREHHHEQPDA